MKKLKRTVPYVPPLGSEFRTRGNKITTIGVCKRCKRTKQLNDVGFCEMCSVIQECRNRGDKL